MTGPNPLAHDGSAGGLLAEWVAELATPYDAVPAPDFWRLTPALALAGEIPFVSEEVALEGLLGAEIICGVLAARLAGAPARYGTNLPEKSSAKPASNRMTYSVREWPVHRCAPFLLVVVS